MKIQPISSTQVGDWCMCFPKDPEVAGLPRPRGIVIGQRVEGTKESNRGYGNMLCVYGRDVRADEYVDLWMPEKQDVFVLEESEIMEDVGVLLEKSLGCWN